MGLKGFEYCLFPGLLFVAMWIAFGVALPLPWWDIVIGAILYEAIAWLAGRS